MVQHLSENLLAPKIHAPTSGRDWWLIIEVYAFGNFLDKILKKKKIFPFKNYGKLNSS